MTSEDALAAGGFTCEDVEASERLMMEAGPQRDVVVLWKQVGGEPVSGRKETGIKETSSTGISPGNA